MTKPKIKSQYYLLRRVRVNKNGYDSSGRYYGTRKSRVYEYQHRTNADVYGFVHARSRAHAKRLVAGKFKHKVNFYR